MEYQLRPINKSVNWSGSNQAIVMHDTSNYEILNGINGEENFQNEIRENQPRRKLSYPIKTRDYGKWSPTEQGATLVWRDVCVYAPQSSDQKQPIKRIINNASGAVTPGMLVALMGSSGAGKSTLMSALAYRSPGELSTEMCYYLE